MSARLLRIVLGAWALLFGFAFVAAPKSCEWGLSAYTWTGLAMALAAFATPFFLPGDTPSLQRALHGLGYLAGTLVVWIAGLFIANIQIMCRLF